MKSKKKEELLNKPWRKSAQKSKSLKKVAPAKVTGLVNVISSFKDKIPTPLYYGFFVTLSLAGLYLVGLILSLSLYRSGDLEQIDFKKLRTDDYSSQYAKSDKNQSIYNQVIIPKIGLQVPVLEGGEESLNYGSWRKFPERGSITAEDNFVLTGHRFAIALGIGETRKRSPFYNIDKVDVGDSILIVWEDEEHEYRVEKIFEVEPGDVWVEGPSDYRKLTLYTCTLGGESDGRVVIEALPI